jgi:hypothetical protein
MPQRPYGIIFKTFSRLPHKAALGDHLQMQAVPLRAARRAAVAEAEADSPTRVARGAPEVLVAPEAPEAPEVLVVAAAATSKRWRRKADKTKGSRRILVPNMLSRWAANGQAERLKGPAVPETMPR